MRTIRIEAVFDDEASVWVAESPDLPLVTEAATVEALLAKLPGMIADLLEDVHNIDVPIEFVARTNRELHLDRAA